MVILPSYQYNLQLYVSEYIQRYIVSNTVYISHMYIYIVLNFLDYILFGESKLKNKMFSKLCLQNLYMLNNGCFSIHLCIVINNS